MRMNSVARILVLSIVVFASCTATRNVAVSTFRVLDTPHRYIRERIDPETTTTMTTTTTQTSDVVTPGRPVETTRAKTRSRPPSVGSGAPSNTGAPRPPRSSTARTQPKTPSAPPRAPATATQFPTAKPVPGRPGYVYSIDPKGGIVDVTGYKPGDKAKDPYTQQVFVVP